MHFITKDINFTLVNMYRGIVYYCVEMPTIELTNVSKVYGFGNATTVALDEVNLTIEPGEFVAIMGPSGSGKSTLMNLIGLLDHPSEGSYKLGERYISRIKQARKAKIRRDTVGFIFQSFNLLPDMTALENVALPLTYKGVGRTKRMKLAAEALNKVGLSDKNYFYPYQLSGGQMQRVAIARALVNEPQILIADEPTGNLDSESSRVVMEVLNEIHCMGNTILMVTHNPELTRYATRIVFMKDGAIVTDQQSTVGELPDIIKRRSYFVPRTSLDEDAAGVSALMNIKDDKQQPEKKDVRKKPKGTRKYTSRNKPTSVVTKK